MTNSVFLPWSTPAILAVLVNCLTAAEPRVLIPVSTDSAATWRYTTDKPHADWTKPDFDDGSWSEGKAGFGVADYVTPPDTIGTPWTTSDLWLRKTIDVPAPFEFTSAGVIVRHDKDVELYVGGTLVFSVPGFNTKYDAYDVTKQLKATLKPGKDFVAVHVRQTGGGQYIDLGLVLDPKQKLAVAITPIDPAERQQARDARWSQEKTWKWYNEQPWPCGFKDIIGAFKDDARVWVWDLYNEPTNGGLGNGLGTPARAAAHAQAGVAPQVALVG